MGQKVQGLACQYRSMLKEWDLGTSVAEMSVLSRDCQIVFGWLKVRERLGQLCLGRHSGR